MMLKVRNKIKKQSKKYKGLERSIDSFVYLTNEFLKEMEIIGIKDLNEWNLKRASAPVKRKTETLLIRKTDDPIQINNHPKSSFE